ncbi:hypothetical protein MAMC_02180 [Methylacidimicrobium cyclopophantes]|uniref:Methyltransferase type 11 domain-containing protein n=1 Tax=Methylacidimicrobium cyclopophantes TaxID=1041766 RepID=A0A5E6MK49_9BACT|nr:methyltransferase domain-containing protein [Methylacidimicrobium cyclopophantes]VVM08465.1 hypothetical protein MAMC_02180 [Methylacidimicrobium cyclopophantes]
MSRRAEFSRYIPHPKEPGILAIEIGPWFAPIFPKKEGYPCLVLDLYDRKTLQERAERDPYIPRERIPDIEEVDLVGSASEIAEIVAAHYPLSSFAYIISSHNFEHLPNPIRFLQGCAKVLKPGGYPLDGPTRCTHLF